MADPEILATQQEGTRNGSVGASSGFAAGEQVAGRYVVDGPLGRGASGEVLSVTDLSLDRSVAMKVLRGAGGPVIARFMREARLTARIDHPNVPPVHLLEFLPDGGVLFTMRRLDGASLGDAIRRRAAGEAVPALAATNGIVQIAQRVCDALARAHALGIVHRDVKPDNIMLGAHGDVALVDWGECRLLSEPDGDPAGSTVGTPAYMSPEQARGEPADQRSDIYAIGATLYHTLTGHLPLWDADPERFWERKRSGGIDPLPAEVEAATPRRLLAIARRALDPRTEGRYASVQDLAADLDRYQGGLAVEAYRESSLERAARWLRQHRGMLAAVTAILAIALAGGGLLWREHMRTLGDWGEPVLSEDFAGDAWRQRWYEIEAGTWGARDGEMISLGGMGSFLVLRQPLTGAVAIEYDGRFLPGAQPGDLSVLWTESPDVLNHDVSQYHAEQERGYWVQAGAFDNHFCSIHLRSGGGRDDKAAFRIAEGRTHRFRVELDGRRVRMLIDGRIVTETEDLLPIGTGRIGLFAYYPGKAFSRLRVYQRRVPELLAATAVGDAFLEQKLYDRAIVAYQRTAESLPGTTIATEARYRQGIAARLAGDAAGSARAWSQLTDTKQGWRVAAHHLDDRFRKGEVDAACKALVTLRREHPELRFLTRRIWREWADIALSDNWHRTRPELIDTLLETKQLAFAEDHGLDESQAHLLLRIGRHAEIVRTMRDEVRMYYISVMKLGEEEMGLTVLGDIWGLKSAALLVTGEFATLMTDAYATTDAWIQAHNLSGRIAEGLARYPMNPRLLVGSADPERLLQTCTDPEVRASALAALGRWDEAVAALVPDSGLVPRIRMLAGTYDPSGIGHNPEEEEQAWGMVVRAAAGDEAGRAALAGELQRWWPDWFRWVTWLVIDPSLRPAAERPALLRARLEETWKVGGRKVSRTPWHLAGFALGHLDEAALAAMPAAVQAPMWTAIGRALRAELAGDEPAVRQAWQDYRRLSWRQRIYELMPMPGLERLALFKTEQR
jgi:hypothetical protein